MKTIDLFEYDKKLYSSEVKFICGVDEVGRGPLAGPVTVCACIMDPDKPMINGVNDSKKLTEKKREELFNIIKENSLCFSIVSKDEKIIDSINILNATKEAMKEAVLGLKVKPDLVLIDAVHIDGVENQKSIIKGDATSYAIACASILAKVTRDHFIAEMDKQFPMYNFAKNKGYGTKEHINAIKKYGICKIHRLSYVKNFIGESHEN